MQIVTVFIALIAIATSPSAFGGDNTSRTPIGLGIVPPIQFPEQKFLVTGIRTSLLWGDNRGVRGLDLGLIGNISNQEFQGIALSGVFNLNRGRTVITGIQFALATNMNLNNTNIYGAQISLANVGDYTDIHGFQIGLYNRANQVYGFQIGLVNSTKNLHGVQLGLANFNLAGPFYVSPLINVGF